jgi:hypothetical protein
MVGWSVRFGTNALLAVDGLMHHLGAVAFIVWFSMPPIGTERTITTPQLFVRN